MKLEFSRYVEEDLDNIADFIAQDNPVRAVTFIQDIRQKCLSIQHTPYHYQLRPDIGDEARLAVVGNYSILFRVVSDQRVRIERVVYGARYLPQMLDPS
ncbi:type II toxin-antitoxin system RelE/ParE family toxin [Pseudomonas bubulae]|uniref:type II toxin-antitoxin system RelE/ParE family toxin n=1 Tax=Pseudomonas bubulae TaxID=2316085 RepID=UPI002B1DC8D0|nr:type II toxin-antitoxin system RelE/ParE family toxin [Pseudomonas bubulae]